MNCLRAEQPLSGENAGGAGIGTDARRMTGRHGMNYRCFPRVVGAVASR